MQEISIEQICKELVKIVQTTKDREELKKKIAAYHERDIANANRRIR